MFRATRLVADLNTALRSLCRRPTHSALVVTLMVLGVGGTTAIYSLMHSILVEPLGFEAEDRLVHLDERAPEWNLESVSIDPADFLAWREGSRHFEAMALYRDREFNLTPGDGEPERLLGGQVSHDFLDVLGLAPVVGRSFRAEEDVPDGPAVVMLGHELWRSRFGGTSEVLGTTVRLDAVAHEIVGVLPPGLHLPEETQLLVPAAPDPDRPGSYSYDAIGRLRTGVSVQQAAADLDAALADLKEAYPYKQATSAVVQPLREYLVGDSRRAVETLMVATLLVLLVACANVASLMLAGGEARRREIGVRRALGAGRWDVVRQLLVESLSLALLGAGVGVGVAWAGLALVSRFGVETLPFWVELALQPTATALSVTACVGVMALFGLLAAVHSSGTPPRETLRSQDARGGGDPRRHRALSALVTGEMALAQLLLVGAALVLLSQLRMLDNDPGFRVEGVQSFHVALPESTYGDAADRMIFYQRLRERAASLPGNTTALIDLPPLQGHNGGFFGAEGGIERDEDTPRPVVLVRWASADYFSVVDIPLVAGRTFREPGLLELPELDDDGELVDPEAGYAPYEVVVNETFAHTFFGDRDPVGRRIRTDGHWMTIAGVSRDVRHYGLDQEVRPGVYLPLGAPVWSRVPSRLAVVAASDGAGAAALETFARSARLVVADIDPELPVFDVTSFSGELGRSTALRRLTSWLLGLFAATALALAAFGTFAVLSFVVGQRRHELGVRMALGASRVSLLRHVLGRGLSLAVLGSALGLGAALAFGGLLSTLLYGVEARDPTVMVGVSLLLLGVATLANAVPAFRASRLDPMKVLRSS
ncbi:MAG: ABC transporter permease [Thermoanaerobaculia bacterium]|nr:ABC transporter permease [Thermoanaerobaculia bacterium]